MSLEHANEFASAAAANPALMGDVMKLAAGKSPAEIAAAVSLAGKKIGLDFTPQEASAAREAFLAANAGSGELSDAELNGVAGGAGQKFLQFEHTVGAGLQQAAHTVSTGVQQAAHTVATGVQQGAHAVGGGMQNAPGAVFNGIGGLAGAMTPGLNNFNNVMHMDQANAGIDKFQAGLSHAPHVVAGAIEHGAHLAVPVITHAAQTVATGVQQAAHTVATAVVQNEHKVESALASVFGAW